MEQIKLELSKPPQIIAGADVETVGSLHSFATFSKCKRYRYILGRIWNLHAPVMVCCLLNPSTADEHQLDPTLRRVFGFAKRDRFGSFIIVNAFAFRSTDRKALMKVDDPVGPRNDEAIISSIQQPLIGQAIAGWGRPDNERIRRRMAKVLALPTNNRQWHTFGNLTKGGYPRHPLYLSKDTPIEDYVTLRQKQYNETRPYKHGKAF